MDVISHWLWGMAVTHGKIKGRFSGATRGFCIGHVGPEASVGGPIALLRNGDIIDLDAKKGTINVRLSKKELKIRKKK